MSTNLKNRTLATVLRTRRNHPEIAAEFDQHLQDSIDHPQKGSRSGKPIYHAWWPHDRFDVDPLAFEAVVKLDLPSEGFSLGQSFGDHMNRANPANINILLWLTKEKGIGWAGELAAAAQGQPAEQTRITPFLVSYHKYWREHGHISSPTIIHVLSSFGAQLQLDALNEIKSFEQQRLPAEGFTPWNDPTYQDDMTAAYGNLDEAKRALATAKLEGQPQSVLNPLTATVQQRQQQVETAGKRLYAKGMWDQLEDELAKLDAQLHPPGNP